MDVLALDRRAILSPGYRKVLPSGARRRRLPSNPVEGAVVGRIRLAPRRPSGPRACSAARESPPLALGRVSPDVPHLAPSSGPGAPWGMAMLDPGRMCACQRRSRAEPAMRACAGRSCQPARPPRGHEARSWSRSWAALRPWAGSPDAGRRRTGLQCTIIGGVPAGVTSVSVNGWTCMYL